MNNKFINKKKSSGSKYGAKALSRYLLSAMIIAALSACGGGDDNEDDPTPNASVKAGSQKGMLLDIAGLRFVTSSGVNGTTDSEGEFSYNEEDIISFYVGGIKIGEAKAESMMTTLHFIDDQNVSLETERVTDITRFLLSIDQDEYSGNGIKVGEAVHELTANDSADYSDLDVPFSATNELVAAISRTKGIDAPEIVSLLSRKTAELWLNLLLDDLGPIVVHTTPTYRDEQNLSVLPSIESLDVRFSKLVDAKTIDDTTFVVTDAAGSVVEGDILVGGGASAGLVASFYPRDALATDTEFLVTLSAGIQDVNAQSLIGEYTFSFTTSVAQASPLACIDPARLNPIVSTEQNSVVNISFSLMDCSGNAVEDVDASNFSFFEGDSAAPVFNNLHETYRGYPGAPYIADSIDTVILVDNSTSISDADFQAYISLAKSLVATGTDNRSALLEGQRVEVFPFSSFIVANGARNSNNTLTLVENIDGIVNDGSPSTSFYQLITFFAQNMGAATLTNKKSLVILSDAVDTSGLSSIDSAVNAINNNGINVYLMSQNGGIDPADANAFNLVSDVATIKTDLLRLKTESENYIRSLYHFQYSSPKRGEADQLLTFDIQGNTNLSDDEKRLGSFDSSGFDDQPPVLRLASDRQAIVVPAGGNVEASVVSEFAGGTTDYGWTAADTSVATISPDATNSSIALIEGGSVGNTSLEVNDNFNELQITAGDNTANPVIPPSNPVTIYVGDVYEYDFETGLQGWGGATGWGSVSVSSAERLNTSNLALGIPSDGGFYPADATSSNGLSLTSPTMDLSRFVGGFPVLEFKYKLRNADTNDFVVVEISLDGGENYLPLTTLSTFTHDWKKSGTIALSAYTASDVVKLRFRFESDDSGQYEGFMVDHVKVYPTQ